MAFDVTVIGAGIVGLATARELLARHPHLSLAVVDKEATVAAHQSGHNSGVVHAGIYYAPGSLKARLCTDGKARLEEYAADRGIPVDRCGKVVVAVDGDERGRLDALHERARANGVPGLERLGPAGLRDLEPHATGVDALHSPTTGVVDFRRVAEALADDVRAAGGVLLLGRRVTSAGRRGGRVVLATPGGEVATRAVVACAGLHSDRVARLLGAPSAERIVAFRGDYHTVVGEARGLVRGLIYPVPDPRFPFLGVHLTRTVDGGVIAGPNAVLALAREGYRRRDVDLREVASVVGHRGVRRLARRYWRTGLGEVWRDVSSRAFLRALRRYVPELAAADLRFGPSGVRAQALDPDGTLVDDFRIGHGDGVMAVRNAPSPAATASLAIAAALADRAEQHLDGLARPR